MSKRGLCCGPVSVRPSVTLVNCIQTAEEIVKLLWRPGSPIILVFWPSAPAPNSKGNPFSGGAKYNGVWKFCDFRLKSPSTSRKRYEIGPWLICYETSIWSQSWLITIKSYVHSSSWDATEAVFVWLQSVYPSLNIVAGNDDRMSPADWRDAGFDAIATDCWCWCWWAGRGISGGLSGSSVDTEGPFWSLLLLSLISGFSRRLIYPPRRNSLPKRARLTRSCGEFSSAAEK